VYNIYVNSDAQFLKPTAHRREHYRLFTVICKATDVNNLCNIPVLL